VYSNRLHCLDTTTSGKNSDTESVLPDSSKTSIVLPTQGKDGGAPAIECQPTGVYTVPDPTECNSYYQCERSIRTKLNCPERQLFDADKHQCMEYERVFCGARSVNLADKNQCRLL
jgi:hypothetical protein